MATSRVGSGRRRFARGRGDRGAALVEFALLAPLLFLVLFGIVEFGWTFLQNLDVRSGAREGIRLVAVNYNPNGNSGDTQTSDIAHEICNRMDKKAGVTVAITHVPPLSSGGTTAIGGTAKVTISKPDQQLTKFLAFALNGVTLKSSVQTRLEQASTWNDTTSPIAC